MDHSLSSPNLMKKTYPVAIIGGGLAGFMAYVVLRFRGMKTSDIAVIASEAAPHTSWYQFVSSIWQTSMRSESTGHFFPTDSPGLATVEAFTYWSIKPLIQSWFNVYHPSVATIIAHIQGLVAQTGYEKSLHKAKVQEIHRHGEGFDMYDENQELILRAQHIIISVGHGPLNVPECVQEFQTKHPGDKRVRHAFVSGEDALPNETVLVMGNGITSATLWLHCLQKGASVIGVSPDAFTMYQPLNTPRHYFSRRGLKPFRAQDKEARFQELREAKQGTFPPYGNWKQEFKTAAATGRLTQVLGLVTQIEREENGKLRCVVQSPDGQGMHVYIVDRVIASTGFKPASLNPLWDNLIRRYQLPLVHSCIEIDEQFCLPSLSQPNSIAGVVGAAADWALPGADSFGGMKIAAHVLADTILGKERFNIPYGIFKLRSWLRLISNQTI